MTKTLFWIKTYGCQMNSYDSDKISDILIEKLDYSPTISVDSSDVTILMTCHIRHKATDKLYSQLGRLKEFKQKNKKLIIIVAGCVAQAENKEIFKRAPYVDIIVGPQSYHELPKLIKNIKSNAKTPLQQINIEVPVIEKFNFLSSDVLPNKKISSFVSIQEGCDKFCHFCCVPYTRGPEYSRSVDQIYNEILSLVKHGCKEVTLLGQNVNAYHGTKTDSKTEYNLGQLIELISTIPEIDRIRYMTSHPVDMHEELFLAHKNLPKLMPYLHLPVQSGSDKILKQMNRKHSSLEYINIINRLKDSTPDLALSSDFIVGYPGETDEDFEDTLKLVNQITFSSSYAFKYSPRPGTPAAEKIQIEESVKDIRLQKLQAILQEQNIKFNQRCIDKNVQVLFETYNPKQQQLYGKTQWNQSLHLDISPNNYQDFLGKIVTVKVKTTTLKTLRGELVS